MLICSNSKCCEKCKQTIDYHHKVHISADIAVPDPKVSDSRPKRIDSFNLCTSCYKQYSAVIAEWINE